MKATRNHLMQQTVADANQNYDQESSPDPYSAYMRDIGLLTSKYSNEEQAELQSAANEGDMFAHEELWKQAQFVVLFVYNRMVRAGRLPTAKQDIDAIQEANLAAGEALRRWDPSRGTLATWLVPTIRGVLLNYANTHRNGGIGSKHTSPILEGLDEIVASEEILGPLEDNPGVEGVEHITREESLVYPEGEVFPSPEPETDRAHLYERVLAMPEQYREPMLAHYWDGLPIGAIAAQMGVSTETIRRHLRSGEEWLAKNTH